MAPISAVHLHRRAIAASLDARSAAWGSREAVGDQAMARIFEHLAAMVARAAGRPRSFALALTIVLGWALSGPLFGWSNTWQLVINTGTTIVTFLMVFLIQNAQNRDASAIQAKLDELIRAVAHARNEFIGIEHLSEADLVAILAAIERDSGDEQARHRAVGRLIARR